MKHAPHLLAAALLMMAGACGGSTRNIRGTQIPDTAMNRDILAAVDAYRQAVERRDAPSLLLMASPDYWEDSGTPSAGDDYGHAGLAEVLAGRFQKASDVRVALRTVAIRKACPTPDFGAGCRAHVEVLVDASYSVVDARGQMRRPDKRDQNELVFEWTGEQWKIISGM